jgi:hypothetical protein
LGHARESSTPRLGKGLVAIYGHHGSHSTMSAGTPSLFPCPSINRWQLGTRLRLHSQRLISSRVRHEARVEGPDGGIACGMRNFSEFSAVLLVQKRDPPLRENQQPFWCKLNVPLSSLAWRLIAGKPGSRPMSKMKVASLTRCAVDRKRLRRNNHESQQGKSGVK